ncbi:MAG: 3-dehydroquinate synthase [Eubacteriales bacterium]|nr:3-dehydroquinate synthase [Eubacteriales bacterium]
MAERMTVSYQRKPCYDIIFTNGFEGLREELAKDESLQNRKICIVTDSNVEPLYAQAVREIISPCVKACEIFTFPAGEENKNLQTVQSLYAFLIERHFDRKDMLAALGGGVVGDLTGFAAATYLRGVDFIQIPTTLLAQVDSSIGGKTGVDFDAYKNMVGAFYMPKLVYMNLDTLQTLEARQFFNGFAEVMKHGLIKDSKFYEWLISNMYEICDREPATMLELVKRSCEIKRSVVEKDPTEQGERALLNFGHTIGHAIEKNSNFTLMHGECVALGCVAAAFISWKRELIEMEEYYEIRDMFVPFNLPISMEDLDVERIVELTRSDKKMKSGQIRFVLLTKIGKAVLDDTVTEEEMKAAVEELNFREED